MACVLLECFENFLPDPYYVPLPWYMITLLIHNIYFADYTSEQFVLLSLPTTARRNSVQLRWYQPSYSGYRRDVWSLDDVVIGATDTPQLSQSVAGYVDDFNSGGYR